MEISRIYLLFVQSLAIYVIMFNIESLYCILLNKIISYQIISAGYSFWPLIAQIHFFYLPPTALCGRYSPFLFSFSRGAKPPRPPHTLPPWTSACPPTLFHFACIVYRSPPPNFISKT